MVAVKRRQRRSRKSCGLYRNVCLRIPHGFTFSHNKSHQPSNSSPTSTQRSPRSQLRNPRFTTELRYSLTRIDQYFPTLMPWNKSSNRKITSLCQRVPLNNAPIFHSAGTPPISRYAGSQQSPSKSSLRCHPHLSTTPSLRR